MSLHFSDLGETILSKSLSAVIDSVEMSDTVVQTIDDCLSVDFGFLQEVLTRTITFLG